MTCQSCPNPVEYTFYTGKEQKVTNVCKAHFYATKSDKDPSTYIIRPRTLQAHIADYKLHRI